MAIRIARGVAPPVDLGVAASREATAALSVSTWEPIWIAPVACVLRNVIFLPTNSTAGTVSDYWKGHLCVSRFLDGNPTGAPGGAGTPVEIAARNADGAHNAIVQHIPWDFGSVDWAENAASLLPGDVVAVYWEKVGAPANLAASRIYTVRAMPGSVA